MSTKHRDGHIQKTLAAIGLIAVTAGAILFPSTDDATIPVRTTPAIRGVEAAVHVAPPHVPPPITRDHATKVIINLEVVETTRLFVGNGGPNLVSSFHVIGEIFDKVYTEGGSTPTHNVQTTLVPAGGATFAEFRVEVPGTFIMVDHSIFRATNRGALGLINVTGDDRPLIFNADPRLITD